MNQNEIDCLRAINVAATNLADILEEWNVEAGRYELEPHHSSLRITVGWMAEFAKRTVRRNEFAINNAESKRTGE